MATRAKARDDIQEEVRRGQAWLARHRSHLPDDIAVFLEEGLATARTPYHIDILRLATHWYVARQRHPR